jgi:hypothetical protein
MFACTAFRAAGQAVRAAESGNARRTFGAAWLAPPGPRVAACRRCRGSPDGPQRGPPRSPESGVPGRAVESEARLASEEAGRTRGEQTLGTARRAMSYCAVAPGRCRLPPDAAMPRLCGRCIGMPSAADNRREPRRSPPCVLGFQAACGAGASAGGGVTLTRRDLRTSTPSAAERSPERSSCVACVPATSLLCLLRLL